MNQNVTAVYFSATDTNEKTVTTMAKAINKDYKTLNLTHFDSITEKKQFSKDDLIVIGAPVYGGRIYEGAMKRFSYLYGDQTPCIVTVTYGNRHYDDALLELCDFCESHGFIPFAAAAVIGQHTFGTIQVGRPNEEDVKEDIAFVEKAVHKLEQTKPLTRVLVPGNHPYVNGGSGAGFRPRTTEACTECGLCVSECPEGAISLKSGHVVNDTKCISCFRCVKVCPSHAKVVDTKEYLDFAVSFSEQLKERRENEYFI